MLEKQLGLKNAFKVSCINTSTSPKLLQVILNYSMRRTVCWDVLFGPTPSLRPSVGQGDDLLFNYRSRAAPCDCGKLASTLQHRLCCMDSIHKFKLGVLTQLTQDPLFAEGFWTAKPGLSFHAARPVGCLQIRSLAATKEPVVMWAEAA